MICCRKIIFICLKINDYLFHNTFKKIYLKNLILDSLNVDYLKNLIDEKSILENIPSDKLILKQETLLK